MRKYLVQNRSTVMPKVIFSVRDWPASSSGSLAPGTCQAIVAINMPLNCYLEWNKDKIR